MHIIFFYFSEVFLVCFYSPSNTTNKLLIFTHVPSLRRSRHPRTLNSEFECLQSCQQSGTISFSRFTGAPSFSGVTSEDTTKKPTMADLKILQFTLSSASNTQQKQSPKLEFLELQITLKERNQPCSLYIRKMFPWKQSWGEDIVFTGSGSTLNYFRPLRFFFCWSREKQLPWCESPEQASAAPQEGFHPHCNSRRSNHPQSFTRSHLGPPACSSSWSWKGSHELISGILVFADFQKKLKEHPECSYRENEEEMDGMKELPKDSPSQWPQLFLSHFSFQNELFP